MLGYDLNRTEAVIGRKLTELYNKEEQVDKMMGSIADMKRHACNKSNLISQGSRYMNEHSALLCNAIANLNKGLSDFRIGHDKCVRDSISELANLEQTLSSVESRKLNMNREFILLQSKVKSLSQNNDTTSTANLARLIQSEQAKLELLNSKIDQLQRKRTEPTLPRSATAAILLQEQADKIWSMVAALRAANKRSCNAIADKVRELEKIQIEKHEIEQKRANILHNMIETNQQWEKLIQEQKKLDKRESIINTCTEEIERAFAKVSTTPTEPSDFGLSLGLFNIIEMQKANRENDELLEVARLKLSDIESESESDTLFRLQRVLKQNKALKQKILNTELDIKNSLQKLKRKRSKLTEKQIILVEAQNDCIATQADHDSTHDYILSLEQKVELKRKSVDTRWATLMHSVDQLIQFITLYHLEAVGICESIKNCY